MKSILKKVVGVALAAVLALGMIGCSNGSSDDPVMPPVSGKQTVATPAFSVASGAVNSGTEVTITCGTEGAKIYYTKDGTAPTASSTEYKAAISVTPPMTLKAIAVKSGMNNSAVASASYTISSGKIPEGFVKVKGTTITGNESWTPSSEVFVRGRSITIPDMYVCDHEVTRGEFKELMGIDPSAARACDKDGNELTGDAVLNNPVNCVNWYDAIAYCNKLSLKENLTPCYSVSGVTDWENLDYSSIPTKSDTNWNALTYDKEADGYRLPTEAEWEWLARGGENYTYAGSNAVGDVAWYKFKTEGSRDVKTKQANGYGLYDMSGNVWEWCYDWYTDTVNSSTADTGASAGSNRVLRGGSWYGNSYYCQVSRRRPDYPGVRYDFDGFRVVRSSVKEKVATPAFSVASGAVNSGTSVTITCGTEGAKIYYTKDGTAPTASSTEYKAAISVTAAVTLKAIAVKSGMNNSAVASASYTISSGKTPQGFVKVKGGIVVGKKNTNNYSGVFIEGRTVTLSDFYMSRYEVTQDEYSSVMTGQKVTVSGKEYTLNANPSYCTEGNSSYAVNFGTEQGKRPVEGVTWYDAVYYCNARSEKEGLTAAYDITVTSVSSNGNIEEATVTLVDGADGYRLPTEAEWEYAARGGDPSAADWDYTFSGADTAAETNWDSERNTGLDAVGWYCYNNDTGTTGSSDVTSNASGIGTHQVGQKAPNALGIYDMSGNVWEWCYDWHSSVRAGEETDPLGLSSGFYRVTRGGSWDYDASDASVCYRYGSTPSSRDGDLGFRLVRSAQLTF